MKGNRLLILIASTHVKARKKQSAIAALGVTFGIGTYITLMSFMTGLNGLLDGLILNRTPHIRIYNEVKPSDQQPVNLDARYGDTQIIHTIHSIKPRKTLSNIRNNRGIMNELGMDNRVKGITPQVSARVFYQSGSLLLNGNLIGIDALKEDSLFQFQQYVINGTPKDLAENSQGVILGAGIAKKLSLKKGDYLPLKNAAGKTLRLKIVALFQSGLADIDNLQSYTNIKTAQLVAGENTGYVTDLHIKLHDIEKAAGMSDEISRHFGVSSIDIKRANAQFETGTQVRNLITYAVSATLLLVAGFGIYNILNMLIYEKMNDIAILKATGFNSSDVQRIFIFQALIIGIVGGILGLAIGFLMSYGISQSPFETEALPTIKTFPVNFNSWYYVGGALFALVTTFFAGYLPARKAAKIDPVDILRGQ
jgi:lipoprotein-releasing system permease protein